MNPFKLAIKEIRYRKVNFLMGLLCVIIAVATLAGAMTLLTLHDRRTQLILAEKGQETEAIMDTLKDEMRVAMLKLGLNLVILPAEQNVSNWYLDNNTDVYMPEDYVRRIADSGVITVRHFLPSLQQKIKWPEVERRIILIGTRGEVPNLHKSPKVPIVQPVPDGAIVLGNELHRSLALTEGDSVKLMGESFTVHRCHEERGNQDDVTAWIPLDAAQRLLHQEGKINSILALQCLCKGPDFQTARNDILSVLPDTQVLELGTERRLARAEARMAVGQKAKETLEKEKQHRLQLRAEIEKVTSILVAVVLIASCIWVGFLAMSNVHQRRTEIGVLQAVGFRFTDMMSLFLVRALLSSVVGSVLGLMAGLGVGLLAAVNLEAMRIEAIPLTGLFSVDLILIVFAAMPVLTIIASFVPAVIAFNQDPAIIIRKEAA